jgi:putative transposase
LPFAHGVPLSTGSVTSDITCIPWPPGLRRFCRISRTLPISDAHEGLKAAIRRVCGASWQRCRVHRMRTAWSDGAKTQQSMVAAALRQAFIQPDRAQASATLRHVADQLRQKWRQLAACIGDSEVDVLAYMSFPEQHRAKLPSTNPLERLNKEVKRRADVVGIFPNEAAIVRLIGAVLLEQNDESQLRHRYMQVEAMADLAGSASDAGAKQIPCAA